MNEEKNLSDKVVARYPITDDEYIQILEQCVYPNNCCNCKYNKNCPLDNAITVNIIHRLQRRNKKLKEDNAALQQIVDDYRPENETAFWDGVCDGRKKAAKEIYQELCGHGTTYVKKWIKERYGVEATK